MHLIRSQDDEVIATRTLQLRASDDSCETLRVEILRPMPRPKSEGVGYQCVVRISGLSRPLERTAYGFDAVQALLFAMDHLGTALELSPEGQEGRISFEGEGPPYGFPRLSPVYSDS